MAQTTFKKACRLWEADKARYVKATSMAAYSLTIRSHLEPRFEYLEDITQEAVQKLTDDKISDGLSVPTVKGIILVLKMVVGFCVERGWMENHVRDPKFPARQRKFQPQVLPVREEKLLFDYLYNHPTPLNTGLLICVCCGLRIGEMCALKWKDIDFFGGLIRVRRTVYRIYDIDRIPHRSELRVGLPKTSDSCRDVPVPEALMEILRRQYVDQGQDSFVLSWNHRPIDPQTFRNNYKDVARTLGLPIRRVHGLRHTFATRCVESKCDFKTLSSILGHSNVSTTMNLYVHPGLEQKRKCVEDMMKLL